MDLSGWPAGSLVISAARQAVRTLAEWFASRARNGLFGRWWQAVANSIAAAPQHAWAAVILSALVANAVFLLASGTIVDAVGLAVRGLFVAGASAAAFLQEGRFAVWWRSWRLGRLLLRPAGRKDIDAEVAGPSSPGHSVRLVPAVAAGGILGLVWSLSPGIAFLGLASAGLAVGLRYAVAPEDRNFFVGLFSVSLALRTLLVTGIYVWAVARGRFYPHPTVQDFGLWVPMVFGDGSYFTSRAWALSQIWQGAEVWPHALYEVRQTYGATAFLYIPAMFFYLFGAEGLVAVRFINVLIGACIPVVVYALARDLFGPIAARISAGTAVFFPSLILWSLDLLKDSIFILMVLTAVWLSVRFQQRRKVGYLLAAVGAAVLSSGVRYNVGILLAGLTVLGVVPIAWRRWVGHSPARVLVALFLLAGIGFSPPVQKVMGDQFYWLFSIQRGVAETAGRSTYSLWDRRLYLHLSEESFLADVRPAEVLRAFSLGQYHFWFEPTPWGERSRGERMVIPQMFLWYIVLPFGLVGFWRLRRRPAEFLVLLSFISVMSALIGMTGGNVGTIFRHRDVLTPVLLVIAGGGLAGCFGRRGPSVRDAAGPVEPDARAD